MTKQRMYEKWNGDLESLWQAVYDIGFCEALDEGMALAEAADRGDQRVLDGTANFMELDEWME